MMRKQSNNKFNDTVDRRLLSGIMCGNCAVAWAMHVAQHSELMYLEA
jgi:hypothetical protein